MVYENIMFHNVAALEKWDGYDGLVMARYPQQVREHLEKGKIRAVKTAASEIRFVTSADSFFVTLEAMDQDCRVFVFCGDFFHSVQELKAGVKSCLLIQGKGRLESVCPELLEGSLFHPSVWRIVMDRAIVVFHGVRTFGGEIKPPEPELLPSKHWIAYGSSITMGANATDVTGSYVFRTAQLTGLDVCNLGLAGSCLCEKEAADYLASRKDWDIMTLELGVNMMGRFNGEAFYERAEYMLGKILENAGNRPVVLISPFENGYRGLPETDLGKIRTKEYADVFPVLVKKFSGKNFFFLDGRDLSGGIQGLTCDLLHPSNAGHAAIAAALAEKLKEIITGSVKNYVV